MTELEALRVVDLQNWATEAHSYAKLCCAVCAATRGMMSSECCQGGRPTELGYQSTLCEKNCCAVCAATRGMTELEALKLGMDYAKTAFRKEAQILFILQSYGERAGLRDRFDG